MKVTGSKHWSLLLLIQVLCVNCVCSYFLCRHMQKIKCRQLRIVWLWSQSYRGSMISARLCPETCLLFLSSIMSGWNWGKWNKMADWSGVSALRVRRPEVRYFLIRDFLNNVPADFLWSFTVLEQGKFPAAQVQLLFDELTEVDDRHSSNIQTTECCEGMKSVVGRGFNVSLWNWTFILVSSGLMLFAVSALPFNTDGFYQKHPPLLHN